MLVNCVAYEHGEKVADLPLEDIRGYLKGPGSFVWVAPGRIAPKRGRSQRGHGEAAPTRKAGPPSAGPALPRRLAAGGDQTWVT